jgi:hypothetical protein
LSSKFLDEQELFLAEMEKELGIKFEEDFEDDVLDIRNLETDKFVIPNLNIVDFSNWKELEKEWPSIDYDLFPRWRSTDIPVMITIGVLGALISNGLHDKFKPLHDEKWGRNPFSKGGHSGEDADRLHGLFHRFKHGHDIFNPQEIDWNNYFSKGDMKASLAKKVFAWLRHMLQDTFSTEGLPIPGHSFARDTIKDIVIPFLSGKTDMKQYEVYKTFFTLKMRDLTGAAFIPLAMTGYVFGTEIGNKNKFFNYRYTSLTIGALAISIMAGLMLPHKSFNYGSIAAMIPYIITLFKVNQRINQQLAERNLVLNKNHSSLINNEKLLQNAYQTINHNEGKLKTVHEYLKEMSKQSSQSIQDCMDEINHIFANQDKFLLEVEQKYRHIGGV